MPLWHEASWIDFGLKYPQCIDTMGFLLFKNWQLSLLFTARTKILIPGIIVDGIAYSSNCTRFLSKLKKICQLKFLLNLCCQLKFIIGWTIMIYNDSINVNPRIYSLSSLRNYYFEHANSVCISLPINVDVTLKRENEATLNPGKHSKCKSILRRLLRLSVGTRTGLYLPNFYFTSLFSCHYQSTYD